VLLLQFHTVAISSGLGLSENRGAGRRERGGPLAATAAAAAAAAASRAGGARAVAAAAAWAAAAAAAASAGGAGAAAFVVAGGRGARMLQLELQLGGDGAAKIVGHGPMEGGDGVQSRGQLHVVVDTTNQGDHGPLRVGQRLVTIQKRIQVGGDARPGGAVGREG
jgi:hypothetical protein